MSLEETAKLVLEAATQLEVKSSDGMTWLILRPHHGRGTGCCSVMFNKSDAIEAQQAVAYESWFAEINRLRADLKKIVGED